MYTGKRTLDITISLTALLIAMPYLMFAGIFLTLLSTSSPLFIQERPGYLGAPIKVYKLRTMYPKTGIRSKILNRFGRILRTYSIDELPQLLNVLKGEMSIVGPRPLLSEYLSLYNEFQFRRHEVKPGITGWAQIHGRNTLDWKERFELDVWYVYHQSLKLDLLIIQKTFQNLFNPKDVRPEGLSDEEKFRGNIQY